MRIKSRWRNENPDRPIEENANALAYIIWKIGLNGAKRMQDERYLMSRETAVAVVEAFVIFLIHAADRLAYAWFDDTEEGRERFIVPLAKRLANIVHENKKESAPDTDHRAAFIKKLNEQGAHYAECTFEDEEPGYSFRRYFATQVGQCMDAEDRRWVEDLILDVEAPEAMKNLKTGMRGLLGA